MAQKTFRLLLASRSPRRRQILKEADLWSQALPSNSSESFNENLTLDQNLRKISKDKVEAVAISLNPYNLRRIIILGADTIVIIKNHVLGKPKNYHDALRMLRLLSGKRHDVWTGFCLYCASQQKWISKVVKTRVGFRRLSNKDL